MFALKTDFREDNLNKDSSVSASIDLSLKESQRSKYLVSNATDTTLDRKYKRIMNLNKAPKQKPKSDLSALSDEKSEVKYANSQTLTLKLAALLVAKMDDFTEGPKEHKLVGNKGEYRIEHNHSHRSGESKDRCYNDIVIMLQAKIKEGLKAKSEYLKDFMPTLIENKLIPPWE